MPLFWHQPDSTAPQSSLNTGFSVVGTALATPCSTKFRSTSEGFPDMSISFDKALGIHEKALGFRAQRAEVLANNIANADTPNYKARDMDFSSVLAAETSKQQGGRFAMDRTNSRHIEAEGSPSRLTIPSSTARRCSRRSTRTPWMRRSSNRTTRKTRLASRPASPCSTVNSKGWFPPCGENDHVPFQCLQHCR